MKSLENLKDWLDVEEHQLIGEILMQSGKISLKDLGMALDIQKFEEMHLGFILMNMKVISKEDLSSALRLQIEIDKLIKQRSK